MSFTRGARHHGGFVKPGEEIKDLPGRHSREGWVHMTDHSSTYIEGKQYKHMREWSRPCAICGGAISAFEKMGTVDANSRFSNRTCKDHRGLLPAFEKGFIAWSKEAGAIVAGHSCRGGAAVDTEALEELQGLRELTVEWGAVWKACHPLLIAHGLVGIDTFAAALQRLAEHDRAAFEEVQVLKAKLAQFDLSTAFAAIGCEPVQNTTGSKLTFPWQTD